MNSRTSNIQRISRDTRKLLFQLKDRMHNDFSGVGLIVWDGVSNLPIHPMRETQPDNIKELETLDALHRISNINSIYHDGFHVLNQSLKIIQVAAYFSPPPVSSICFEKIPTAYGGRYLAAKFGSFLKGVICTGVLTKRYGPIIFNNGIESNV